VPDPLRKLAFDLPSRLVEYPGLALGSRRARRAVRARLETLGGSDEAVDFISGFRSGEVTVPLVQVRSEIVQLLELLEEEKPRVVLEIGTAGGGTLFLFAQAAASDATLISIDLADRLFGGGYHVSRKVLYTGFARGRQRIELVRASSHDPRTREAVERILGGRPVDFLFIDGDHTYEGVRQDYLDYRELVRPGGLIAFHDIVPCPSRPESVGGVPDFWRELEAEGGTWTFVDPAGEGGFGIGLVRRIRYE
jgi:predicted O-methyltransferase YrrM